MSTTAVFDMLAKNYDVDFTTSRIGQLQRTRVRHFLMPVLNKKGTPLKILEINCGTGEDALWLSSLGHTVIATDASAVMIEKAKAKQAYNAGDNNAVDFLQCSFSELIDMFPNEKFDLIFSDFGGLNCVDENALTTLSHDLSILTNESSHIFFVIMARYCAWEIGYYTLKGQFKTAFRRTTKINFTIDKEQMPVYYYGPRTVKKIFNKKFEYVNKKPVGLFIPPSYLENYFQKHTKQLQRFNHWEENCCPAALSAFADHYCITFTKTAAKK
jgi:SAM-dependent methyltransferase